MQTQADGYLGKNLRDVVGELCTDVTGALEGFDYRPQRSERGIVERLGDGVVRVSGLVGVGFDEVIEFGNGTFGLALELDRDSVGVVLLDDDAGISAGTSVRRTKRVMDVGVGEGLLGRVVDAAGRPLDEAGPIHVTERRRIERRPPAIMDRGPVHEPLPTGIIAIDALVPIGRGQRELIVGDRQTGKTTIAIDTIVNQRTTDVICVYCAIGQQTASVAKVVAELRGTGALDHTIVVVASDEDPVGLRYAAPYAATAMAEYFMDCGRDVLIVYDDLTRHARSYRELSLLLRRPPGREAYPGDIFYVHSRLLERAARLRDDAGGGSLTALPIIETQAGNLSAYIPTNLVSITDGQVYVSPRLFRSGQLPAVDVGRSVSRVGGRAQQPAYLSVGGKLRLAYTQFEELERFTRYGARLEDERRAQLERGRRVREVLKQQPSDPRSSLEQIALLVAVTEGALDDIDLEDIGTIEQRLRPRVGELTDLVDALDRGDRLDADARRSVVELIEDIT
jgi:F-type H+-transporting ATPase subunit alpha